MFVAGNEHDPLHNFIIWFDEDVALEISYVSLGGLVL